MSDEKLKAMLKWIPLAIAAGYFLFLIATWQQFLKQQARNKDQFDQALDAWMRERNAKPDES